MAASSAPVRKRMLEVLPDCVFPSSQRIGVGVLVRNSASVASKSGGGLESPVTVSFTASQNRLISPPTRADARVGDSLRESSILCLSEMITRGASHLLFTSP